MAIRLSAEQRRAQLLDLGAELFAGRPYEQVALEEVAVAAQISSGLLYHYFPSKWAFFKAIAEREGAKLVAASTPDPALSPLEQVKAGLDVYIEYAQQHPSSFRVAHRTMATDEDRHVVHQSRVSAQRERALTILSAVMPVDDRTQIALTGWLAFVPAAILDWLDNPAISRDELRDLCARAFVSAVGLRTENRTPITD